MEEKKPLKSRISGEEFKFFLAKCKVPCTTFGKNVGKTAQTVKNWMQLPEVPIAAELALEKLLTKKRFNALRQEFHQAEETK